jgi:hypothetical protein
MILRQHLLMLLLLSSICLAQDPSKETPKRPDREMIGTSLARNTCKAAVDENDEKVHVCDGVDKYSVLVKGDEKKPQIVLVAPDGTKHPIHYWDTSDPGFEELQPSILWIVVNEPQKTIAIDFRLKLQRKPGYSQWGHHDIIVKVSPLPVCIVGSLPGSPRSSSDSMAIAGSPDTRPCIGPEEFEKP